MDEPPPDGDIRDRAARRIGRLQVGVRPDDGLAVVGSSVLTGPHRW